MIYSDYNGFWGGRTRRFAPTPNIVGANLCVRPFKSWKIPIINDVPKIRYNQDLFYRNSKKLTLDEVQTFLVSAIKPQEDTRRSYGYENQRYPGV